MGFVVLDGNLQRRKLCWQPFLDTIHSVAEDLPITCRMLKLVLLSGIASSPLLRILGTPDGSNRRNVHHESYIYAISSS